MEHADVEEAPRSPAAKEVEKEVVVEDTPAAPSEGDSSKVERHVQESVKTTTPARRLEAEFARSSAPGPAPANTASTLASDDALAATLVVASDERWEDIVE